MGKNNRNTGAPARTVQTGRPAANPVNVILIGVVCLGIGLFIGYYFGKQSSLPAAASVPMGSLPTGSLGTAATFAKDEAGLKAALTTDPKDLSTIIHLGNLYYDNGRFRDAVDWYGRALDMDSRNVAVRTDRGTSYWNLGQADAAIAEFRKSLDVDPTHAQTLYNLGVVQLHGKNDPAEARKAWEKLLATNPGYPERAKLQEQIAALPASSPMPGAATRQAPGSSGVEDLLQRMKTRR